MTTVYIALGSNLGDRMANIEAAIAELAERVTVQTRSPVYETDPKYVTDQPRFLNMALSGETDLEPSDLLAFLKGIEARLGRQAGVRYGPRPIDLDILFYGDECIERPELKIPHPLMAERAFVLKPLADIAPGMLHPVTARSVAEMLAALQDNGGLVRLDS
jgi:2-amino-4-hydroxy-6-hydroxymethyldihydropteridine diphosphokinase